MESSGGKPSTLLTLCVTTINVEQNDTHRMFEHNTSRIFDIVWNFPFSVIILKWSQKSWVSLTTIIFCSFYAWLDNELPEVLTVE